MVARDAKQERADVERAAEHGILVGVPARWSPQREVGDLGHGTRAPYYLLTYLLAGRRRRLDGAWMPRRGSGGALLASL